MGYRDLVLYIGYGEIGTSLKTNAARVKEYVDLSCTNPSSNYLAVSWCTHFVHWTVEQAGLPDAVPPEACRMGWQQSFDLLTRLVEAEIPTP